MRGGCFSLPFFCMDDGSSVFLLNFNAALVFITNVAVECSCVFNKTDRRAQMACVSENFKEHTNAFLRVL